MRSESEILAELKALCMAPGYSNALAVLCFRDNFVGFKDELKADDYAKLFSWSRLIRTEMSTIIGYLVQGDVDVNKIARTQVEDYVKRTDNLLHELHERMNADFLPLFQSAMRGEIGDPFATAKGMREPIFYSGESAYSFQYRDFAPLKYSKDAAWLQHKFDFDMHQAKMIVNAIHDICQEKVDSFLDLFRAGHVSEVDLLDVFRFSHYDICDRVDLDHNCIASFLKEFSLTAVSNENFRTLEDFNATNAFPLIAKSGNFICFQYYALVEAIYDTPFFWMMGDKAYKDQAARHRGEYLEGFADSCLCNVFGKERVYRNVRIIDGKREIGEIDNLIIFGNRAVVIQAKAKRLTIEARKNNDLRLKEDFSKAIQDAADQGASCSAALMAGKCKFIDGNGSEINLPVKFEEIFPVCLIADHYPALSFQCHAFLKFNSNEIIREVFVMDIFTLDTISEMLTSPLRFLSYLELRAKMGRKMLISHEVTALSFHLRNNLWLQNYDMVHVHDDVSSSLDIAMAARRDGVKGQKTPEGILTNLKGTKIGFIIDSIDKSANQGPVEFGLMLLRLDIGSAKRIGDLMEKLASLSDIVSPRDATVWNKEDNSGVTVHCNCFPSQTAIEKLEVHCALRKYAQKAQRWFGIAIVPASGAIRFGVTLNYDWKQDEALDRATASMRAPIPVRSLERQISQKRKVGRNDMCLCGSGLKYKKCCGRRL